MINLKVSEKFEAMALRLNKTDYNKLKLNIIANTCKEPIIVWNEIILDGYKRYRICTENKIDFEIENLNFANEDMAILWRIENVLNNKEINAEHYKYLLGEKHIVLRNISVLQNGKYVSSKSISEKISKEYNLHACTIYVYEKYASSLDEIFKIDKNLFSNIISGEIKMPIYEVVNFPKPYNENSENKINVKKTKTKQINSSVKDMPIHDPDAKFIQLSLTIPSWINTLKKVEKSQITEVSISAKNKLLRDIEQLESFIKEFSVNIKESLNE